MTFTKPQWQISFFTFKYRSQTIKSQFCKKNSSDRCSAGEFLRNLLLAHQDTVLGREYGLRDIKTIDRFREQVPILPYSSYEPYTTRIAKGEANILTAEPVAHLIQSSGSTGKRNSFPSLGKLRNPWKGLIGLALAF